MTGLILENCTLNSGASNSIVNIMGDPATRDVKIHGILHANAPIGANLTISRGNFTDTGTGIFNILNKKLIYGTAVGGVVALGNLGTSETIDWSQATHFTGTLNDDVTISFTNDVPGQKITLAFIYDGSAQRTITWSDVDKWQNGDEPEEPDTAGQELVVTLVKLGSTVYGSWGLFE